jgi:isopentenyl-diphosphate Delta-isomerase
MSSLKQEVILVDENDKEIGTEEKMKVHMEGKLHRAFSIFIFNSKNEVLLQRRALDKYHAAGLWANSCCSHPRPSEKTLESAHRRLKEEMGFDCQLKEIFTFTYKIIFENGLTEHEIDHVIIGKYNSNPKINEEEVAEYKWVSKEELIKDVKKNPEKYAPWFKICYERVFDFVS